MSIPTTLIATPTGPNRYEVPNDGDAEDRDVVFGGQLMAQVIAIAAARNPAMEVKTIHTIFARPARVSLPTEIEAEQTHSGRTFASETITVRQDGRFCARSMVLLSTDEPDVIRNTTEMPDCAGPQECAALPESALIFPGAQYRIVGDVDTWDVTAPLGPAEMNVWMRYPDAPDDLAVNQAVLAYATDGFLIGASMRPHEGFAQDRAHVDLSTGVVSHTMTFHEPFSTASWLLLAQEVVYSGRGRIYGRANVFTEDATLVASFVQDSIVRLFADPERAQGQKRTIM